MRDYSTISLADAREDYLSTSTTAMPIAGLISWGLLSIVSFNMGDRLPTFAPFIAAAIPFPIALVIDKVRGEPGVRADSRRNPVTQLFMKFITVVALLVPFVIIAAQAAQNLDLLILGMAILAGLVWVPHGWGANDPAGFIHFVMRAVLCYAAYLFVPDAVRGAAIAGAAALTYIYAVAAMRKPSSAR